MQGQDDEKEKKEQEWTRHQKGIVETREDYIY